MASVPEVVGWVTLPQAAEIMGKSRQYVHRMAVKKKFHSLSRIGNTVVVNVWEVHDKAGHYDAPVVSS
jgi:hypothetical protein